MVKTHYSNTSEKHRQSSVMHRILNLKGYLKKQINRMKNANGKQKDRGIHTGTVEYNKLSKTHIFMNKIFREAKEENLLLIYQGNCLKKKMLQYIYTNHKMRTL